MGTCGPSTQAKSDKVISSAHRDGWQFLFFAAGMAAESGCMALQGVGAMCHAVPMPLLCLVCRLYAVNHWLAELSHAVMMFWNTYFRAHMHRQAFFASAMRFETCPSLANMQLSQPSPTTQAFVAALGADLKVSTPTQ